MFLSSENSCHGRRTGQHLFDDGKDPRLVVVVSVCPNAQVDLVLVGIRLICGGEFEDAGGDAQRIDGGCIH